jgi:phosphatidylinositol glycan class B
MSLAVIGSILAFSAIAHKEVRFIYPLLPILHVLAADPVSSFFRRRTTWRAVLLFLGVIVNLYIAYYVTRVHQRGVVDVMHYLRYKQGERLDENISEGIGKQQANLTVGFLMPCHSTPWRSHLVYPEIDAWALTCEPPIHVPLEDRQTYLDEADIFYQDPIAWINKNMAATDDGSQEGKERHLAQRAWPEYLVFFEHLQPTVGALLERNDYHECKRFFNTHWHDDGRRKGDVLVWCARDE